MRNLGPTRQSRVARRAPAVDAETRYTVRIPQDECEITGIEFDVTGSDKYDDIEDMFLRQPSIYPFTEPYDLWNRIPGSDQPQIDGYQWEAGEAKPRMMEFKCAALKIPHLPRIRSNPYAGIFCFPVHISAHQLAILKSATDKTVPTDVASERGHPSNAPPMKFREGGLAIGTVVTSRRDRKRVCRVFYIPAAAVQLHFDRAQHWSHIHR